VSEFLQDPKAIKVLLDEMGIDNATLRYDNERDSMVVDVAGNVYLEHKLDDLARLPVQFGHVSGNFEASYNKLISLEGAPQNVGGSFVVSGNQLTSLDGAPQTVGVGFVVSCNRLASLEGAPQTVSGDFDVSSNQLTSLEGAPQAVSGNFSVSNNHLTSLRGAPQTVSGGFYCHDNQLTSLEGAPQTVSRDFDVSGNQLTSLIGVPQIVSGSFDVSRNQLTSLEGAPQKVDWDFDISDNQLISLEGMPQTVGGKFYCTINPIKDLSGIGKVGGVCIVIPGDLPSFDIAEKGRYDGCDLKEHDYLKIIGNDNIQAYITVSLKAAKVITTESTEPTLASIHIAQTTNEPNPLQTALINKNWAGFCDLIDDPATRGLYDEKIKQVLILSAFDPRLSDNDRAMAKNTLEYTSNVLAFEQERNMSGPSR
jgi:hypothetical protein